MTRLGILLSGRGSNFEALARSVAQGRIQASIAAVVSNVAGAGGIQLAESLGLPAFVLPSRGIEREKYDAQLVELLRRERVELVCLAGFMRLLSPGFVRAFPNAIVNIHPSLLPAFPGLHAQRQALEHGVKFSGCTVHYVDEGLDSGPIIQQAVVPVLDSDTEESLSARILSEEHRIYSEALQAVVSRQIEIRGRKTYRCESQ